MQTAWQGIVARGMRVIAPAIILAAAGCLIIHVERVEKCDANGRTSCETRLKSVEFPSIEADVQISTPANPEPVLAAPDVPSGQPRQ